MDFHSLNEALPDHWAMNIAIIPEESWGIYNEYVTPYLVWLSNRKGESTFWNFDDWKIEKETYPLVEGCVSDAFSVESENHLDEGYEMLTLDEFISIANGTTKPTQIKQSAFAKFMSSLDNKS